MWEREGVDLLHFKVCEGEGEVLVDFVIEEDAIALGIAPLIGHIAFCPLLDTSLAFNAEPGNTAVVFCIENMEED